MLLAAAWSIAAADVYAAQGQTVWKYFPAFEAPGHAGIVVGDFDGDGAQEAAVTGCTKIVYGCSGSEVLATVGRLPNGTHGIREATPFAKTFTSDLFKAPSEAGKDRILTMRPGDYPVVGEFVVLGDEPLRVIRTMPAATAFYIIYAIADIDADGSLDILVSPWCGVYDMVSPMLIDYQTGDVKWTGPSIGCGAAAGQFDADPQLEIVVAGTPGLVLDGKTKATEWSWPGGFGRYVVTGQFDNDPSTQEILALSFDHAQVFVTSPAYSPKSEFPVAAITTHDISDFDHDGVDELDLASDRLRIYDPRNGALLRDYPAYDASSIAIGPMFGDGREQVVYGGGLDTSGEDVLRSFDLTTGQQSLSILDEIGPFSAIAAGAFGAGGALEVAFINGGSTESAATLRALDFQTGLSKRELAPVWPQIGYGARGLATLTAPGKVDLAVAGTNPGNSLAYAERLDGPSLNRTWVRASDTVPAFSGTWLAADTTADVNADGTQDLVVATDTGKLVVLNGANGQKLFESQPVADTGTPYVAARNMDADPQAEYLLARGKNVYVFDSSTLQQQGTFAVPEAIAGILVWGTGTGARLGVLDGTATMGIYAIGTGQFDHGLALPDNPTFARTTSEQGDTFIVAAGGRFHVVHGDGSSEAVSKPLGDDLGSGNTGTLRAADAYRFDVFAWAARGVVRQRVNLEAILEDGFE